jgi:hypothetical protein
METRFALEQARREQGVAARVRLLASAVVTLLTDSGLMRARPSVRQDITLTDLNLAGASDVLAATPAENLARVLAEAEVTPSGVKPVPDDLRARLDSKTTIAMRNGNFWQQSWERYDMVRDQLLSGQLGQANWPDDPLTRLGLAAQACETERSRSVVSLVDAIGFRNRLAQQGLDTSAHDAKLRESVGMKMWNEEFEREQFRTRITMEGVLNAAAARNQPRRPTPGMGM